MCAAITDAGRSRDPYLAVCWHTDTTATCSRDTIPIYCLHSFCMSRSHPATFSYTPSTRCTPYRQQAAICLYTHEESGYSRKAEVVHTPQPGCPRDRESSLEIPHSRRGETPEVGSGDETKDGPPYHHPDPLIKRVDWLVRAEKEPNQSPPDSGASRRQL